MSENLAPEAATAETARSNETSLNDAGANDTGAITCKKHLNPLVTVLVIAIALGVVFFVYQKMTADSPIVLIHKR